MVACWRAIADARAARAVSSPTAPQAAPARPEPAAAPPAGAAPAPSGGAVSVLSAIRLSVGQQPDPVVALGRLVAAPLADHRAPLAREQLERLAAEGRPRSSGRRGGPRARRAGTRSRRRRRRRAGRGRGPRRTGRCARRTGPSRAQRRGRRHQARAHGPADAAGCAAERQGSTSAPQRRRAAPPAGPAPCTQSSGEAGSRWPVSWRDPSGDSTSGARMLLAARPARAGRRRASASEPSTSSASGLISTQIGSSTDATPAFEARPKPTFSPSSTTVARGAARAGGGGAAVGRARVDDDHARSRQVQLRPSAAAARPPPPSCGSRSRAPSRRRGGRRARAGAPARPRRAPSRRATASAASSAKRRRASSASNQPARARPPAPEPLDQLGRGQHLDQRGRRGLGVARAGRAGRSSRPRSRPARRRPAPPPGGPLASAWSTTLPNGSRSAQCSRHQARPSASRGSASSPGEGHAAVEVGLRGALGAGASSSRSPSAFIGAPATVRRSSRHAARRPRDRLERQVGALPRHQRAEQQHLGLGRHAPVARRSRAGRRRG